MCLTGRLVPDHKTIADFRKNNGPAIRKVCAQFVALCREMGLLTKASVAIDGSKFKAANKPRQEFHAREDGAPPRSNYAGEGLTGELRALDALLFVKRRYGSD
jgi:hypothetical protein